MRIRRWLRETRRVQLLLYGRGRLVTLSLILGERYWQPRWERTSVACTMGWAWSEVSYQNWPRGVSIYCKPFGWHARHVCGSRARIAGIRTRTITWGI